MFDPPAEFEFDNDWDAAVEHADLIGWEPDGSWCALFAIGPWGAADKLMEQEPGSTERLRALPLRAVVAYRDCTYLWSIGDDGCSVWQTTWTPALTTEGEVVTILGTAHARADIAEVRSYDDDEARDRHGVEVALRDGSFHGVAMMVRSERTAWAVDLARSLAAHWGVPYRHVCPAGSKPAAVARKREADRQTAQLVDGLVDAYARWDDPDRVAAREAREAATEARNAAVLARAHVESGQRRIAAWDRDDPSRLTIVEAERLSGELVLRVVERRQVTDDTAALTATLRARGDVIGATYRRSLVYWVIDERVCMVWRRDRVLCRVGDVVEVGTRAIPLDQLRAVVAFRVPARLGHRGLALALASGDHVLVHEDDDARHDPKVFTGGGEGFAVAVARELAPALGVEVHEVAADVITRPPPRQNPALEVLAACGPPVLARSLSPEERQRAAREGRVLGAYAFGWRSMGDADYHAGFVRRTTAVEDGDLVFARAVPLHVDGEWPAWETEDDVHAAFGMRAVEAPPPRQR